MAKPQRYQRTREDIQARANQQSGNFDSIFKEKFKVFRPKDGKNIVRILPGTWEDPRHYGYDIFVNYGIGVDNQSYLSLSKMLGKKDPLEEAKRAAEKEGDRKLAAALSPKKRVVMWVIDRSDQDAGPQLWSCPWTVDRDVANLTCDEDTKEVIYIDDEEKGFDLRFYKEGKGRNTEYNPSKMKLLAESPIHEDEDLQKEWIEYTKANPIPSCLNYYDYDHISTMYDGHARVKEEDDEETGDRPRSSRRKDDPEERPATSRRRADPDPEDDPPPRSRRAAAAPDPEDDPPPRSRRSAEADPDDHEERPSVRERLRSRLQDQEAEDDPPPRSRRAAAPDPEDDPPPRSRRAAAAPDPEDDPPPRSRRAAAPEPEAEDDPPPRTRRRADPEPEADDDPPPRRRARV